MSQPGIGAMLHMLSGGSEHNPDEYYDREITDASMEDDKITLSFADGVTIDIWDNGQSCCESRYMTTDDDLSALVGHRLTKIETKPAEDVEGEYGDVHEVVFLEVTAGTEWVTVATHNEHNGYYGGFGLTITERAPAA